MCRALSDPVSPGRRCPIHRHDSHAVNLIATHLSDLNTRQVDSLFRELRREGRHIEPVGADVRTAFLNTLLERAVGTGTERRVNENVAFAVSADAPDGATMYAQQRLIERARERGQNLSNRLQEVADRTGLTKTEVQAKFDAFYDAVDVSYGAVAPSEFTTTTRARAVAAGLPYDQASVVALERLYALPAAQTEDRVRRIQTWHTPASNSHVNRFGYDEGRLEIAFNNDPEKTFAYHNVPEALWEHLRTANRPGRIYSAQLRGNPQYTYADAEAAEADAYRVRCASCGQFRAAVHTCPEREVREVIAEAGVPAAQIPDAMGEMEREVLQSMRDQLGSLNELSTPETEANIRANLAEEEDEEARNAELDADMAGAAEFGNADDGVTTFVPAGSEEHFPTEYLSAIIDRNIMDGMSPYDATQAALAEERNVMTGEGPLGVDEQAALAYQEYVNDSLPELPAELREAVESGEMSLRRAQNVAASAPTREEMAANFERVLDEMVEEDQNAALRAYAEELEAAIAADDADAVVNYDPEEVLANAERASSAPEAAPAAPTIRSTADIVVPVPELTAQSVQQPRPEAIPAGRVEGFRDGEDYHGFKVVDPDMPGYAEYTSSADNQYLPQRFDRESLVAYETTDLSEPWLRKVVKGGEDLGDYYGREVPEDVREMVKTAPENVRFVLSRNRYGQPLEKAFAYDVNRFSITDTTRVGENGRTQNVVQLMRRPAEDANMLPTIPAVIRGENSNEAERNEIIQAWNRAGNEEAEKLRGLIASGEAKHLVANASSSRRYVFDANREKQPSINTAPAIDIRNAIRDNKIAIVPFTISAGRDSLPANYVDDQGYAMSMNAGVEISGDIAVRRNKDGVIEVVSSQRRLKCNCGEYRRRYYCRHISYAQRHMGNVVQQMLPDSMGAGRTVAAAATTEGAAAASHRLMTSPLRRRNDVEIVAGENGRGDFVRATMPERGGQDYRANYLRNGLVLPESARIANPDEPTNEEIHQLQAVSALARSISTVTLPPRMAELRSALRRSEVEVPVRVGFYETGEISQVTGEVTYNQLANAEDAPTIRERHLKCTCAEYQENYDCRHVRLLQDQAHMFINAPGRGMMERPTMYALADQTSIYRNQLAREQQITDEIERARRTAYMYDRANYGRYVPMTREEAIASIAEREAERERQRVADAEARRQRQLRWEEENRERLQREAAERLALNADTVKDTDAYRERMMKRWEEAEPGYSADSKKFFDDYKETLKRKRNKETTVPFRTENVTDGICADEPGARQFGIELEFDIKPGVNRSQALRQIGQELHAAGLTGRAEQTGYHSAAYSGWQKWSFEEDCTVDAELVSPLMKDTPEHWRQLEQALKIIRDNGGIATTRTGSHVHVSTASYGTNTAKHVELLRTINNNDDILYRMASNPERGKHRGMQWCAPNVDDREGDVSADVEAAHNVFGYDHSSHGVGVNFQSTFNPKFEKSNVEFRMWDGTLDAAVIQQQVMVSAAITDYAERKVTVEKVSKREPEKRQRIGQGRGKEAQALSKRNLTTHDEQSFTEANGHVAEFFDKIFRRNEDRQAAMSLFAVTNWQTN